MQFFGPELAKRIAAEVENSSPDEFFKRAGVWPGMLITGREQKDDGTIVLSGQIVPDDDTAKPKMSFRQFDGQWRMISGF